MRFGHGDGAAAYCNANGADVRGIEGIFRV
jgi:hypothetical protein